MLQLAHRTSAPSATRVSISTAVCTVICSEPAILAPVSGLESPYWARIAISPGISCSARLISLRPNSVKVRSATRKSMGASLWEAFGNRGIREQFQKSVAWGGGPLRPRGRNMVRVVDIRLEVERSHHWLRLPDFSLRTIDGLRHLNGGIAWHDRDLGCNQHLFGPEVQGLHMDDPLDARSLSQRPLNPSNGLRAGRLTE